MTLSTDVLVIGGGMVGASIAHSLASDGARVVVVERDFPEKHPREWGSSDAVHIHDNDSARSRLAALSYETFLNWDEAVGGDIGFRRVGYALLAEPGQAAQLARDAESTKLSGANCEIVGSRDFALECPGIDLTGISAVAYEPDGGYADPVRATRALLTAARKEGALILSGPAGGRLRYSGDRVTGVYLGNLNICAGETVLAAGVWSAPLLGRDRVTLRPGRFGMALFDDTGERNQGRLPMIVDRRTGACIRSDGRDRLLLKMSLNDQLIPEGTLGPGAVPAPGFVAAARSSLAARLPGLAGSRLAAAGVMSDGRTPDRRALIGRVGGVTGLYLATGFDGEGFRTAPAVGRAVAAELLSDAVRVELEPFRPGRFTLPESTPSVLPAALGGRRLPVMSRSSHTERGR